MDPTTGIAVVYGIQLAPPADVEGHKVLESTLYLSLPRFERRGLINLKYGGCIPI